MIHTSYDPEGDAVFVWLAPKGTNSADTEEVAPGILLDFDVNARAIGIEVLEVRERTVVLHESGPARATK